MPSCFLFYLEMHLPAPPPLGKMLNQFSNWAKDVFTEWLHLGLLAKPSERQQEVNVTRLLLPVPSCELWQPLSDHIGEML